MNPSPVMNQSQPMNRPFMNPPSDLANSIFAGRMNARRRMAY
jgi:hypothetical protein